jgi:molybdopterin molybdotransferase/putative molybdopterin biosynthesis protein
MAGIETLRSPNKIKLLADPRRLEILRLLMAAPATLTQLARSLNHTPAWIRHHIKILEAADLIEMTEIRTTGRVTEKYYRAKAGAFLLQEMILPKTKIPSVVFSGSHDLALEELAKHLAKHMLVLSLPVGSLDGLLYLRLGFCQVSGAHLLDESGEYNKAFVHRFFPDREMDLMTLAYRTQGLMVSPGNPKKINRLTDLTRPHVRFVNRNSGSGTRLWFDTELKKARENPAAIHGYDHIVNTHTEAASLIEAGRADAAIGLQAAAHQHGLGFIPLFEERYDLVLPREGEKTLSPILNYIQAIEFRRSLDTLTGYNTAHSGELNPV